MELELNEIKEKLLSLSKAMLEASGQKEDWIVSEKYKISVFIGHLRNYTYVDAYVVFGSHGTASFTLFRDPTLRQDIDSVLCFRIEKKKDIYKFYNL